MCISIISPETNNLSLSDIGVSIERGNYPAKRFHLVDVRVRSKKSLWDKGVVEFVVCDEAGCYLANQEVILIWGDGLTVAETNHRGQACLNLLRHVHPNNKCGIVDAGSDELIGVGLLHKQSVVYRLFYQKTR